MRRRHLVATFVLLALAPMLASCSSDPRLHDPTAVHAQCLVCKSEGDLACVDVIVDERTPRTSYNGATYYFCSEQCRRDFDRTPEQYLVVQR
jgi:YHS domain-containing protein